MSLPPPPPGSMPPGQPYQQPHGDQPGYPGPGLQQPLWQQLPAQPPTPKRGNGWKWGLGAVALLAVIGVTVAVTLTVVGKGDGGGSPTGNTQSVTGAANSDIASANDTGPVAVITDDPSCAPAQPILATRGDEQKNSGWDNRDPSIPATAWTPEVRIQYESVAQSMRDSAAQLVPIAKLTPHRTMRELFEQLIAYSRAYADSIPNYMARDDNLALAASSVSTAISHICAAIDYKSAGARGPLTEQLPKPADVATTGDVANPNRFLTEPNSVCGDWSQAWSSFDSDTTEWASTSPDTPASQWTPQQRAINEQVAPVMNRFASQLRALGERSDNPTLRDFADLSAQYRNAYVKALPTYRPADNYLALASLRLTGLVDFACRAVAE